MATPSDHETSDLNRTTREHHPHCGDKRTNHYVHQSSRESQQQQQQQQSNTNKRRGYDTTNSTTTPTSSRSSTSNSSRPSSQHRSDEDHRRSREKDDDNRRRGERMSDDFGYYGRSCGRPDNYENDDDYYRRRYKYEEPSRGYDREPQGRGSGDWKCLECGMWNFRDDNGCYRCGWRRPQIHRSNNEEKVLQRNGSEDGDKGSFDEFGRAARKETKVMKGDPEWPPEFASHSAAYVLDSRCGMFYEKVSDFFYDPKSKLYYGNKKSSYYRYEELQSPPFIQVDSPDDGISPPLSGSQDCSLPVVQSLATPVTAPEGPPKLTIAINLKTKAIKDSKNKRDKKKATNDDDPSKAQQCPPQEPRVHKQHVENIEKWAERGRELREDSPAAPEIKTTLEAPDPGANASSHDKFTTTVKGEPICLLCKRKFPTVDKLRQHEQLSALHKENLAKQTAVISPGTTATSSSSTGNNPPPTLQYRDRARERRVMYGPESQLLATSLTTTTTANPMDEEDVVAVVNPENNLGDTNIGNQMLQKLGWKAGSSLGRNKSDGDGNQDSQRTSTMEASLKEDWKKIESLASGATKGQR